MQRSAGCSDASRGLDFKENSFRPFRPAAAPFTPSLVSLAGLRVYRNAFKAFQLQLIACLRGPPGSLQGLTVSGKVLEVHRLKRAVVYPQAAAVAFS